MNKTVERLREACRDFYDAMHMHSRDHLWKVYYRLEKAIAELLKTPRWETPEQYKRRTGKAYPDKGPVWFRHTCKNYRGEQDFIAWGLKLYKDARDDYDFHPPSYKQIVIAAEAGPPPKKWEMEEEAQ